MCAKNTEKPKKTKAVKFDPRWFAAYDMNKQMGATIAEIAVAYDKSPTTIQIWIAKATEQMKDQPYVATTKEMYKKRLAGLTPRAITTYQKLTGGKTNAALSASRDILTDQNLLMPKTEVKEIRNYDNDQLAEIIAKAFTGISKPNKSGKDS